MGITERVDATRLLDLLAEPEVEALVRRSGRECILRESFMAMPQPSGTSACEMWRLLKAIQRLYSIEIPVPSPGGTKLYYFVHQDMLGRLQRVDYHCHPDSRFSLELFDRRGSLYVVRAQIQETLATSKLDGLRIAYDEAEELIRRDRKPRNSAEILVKNVYRTAADIGTYVEERFSPELLREFFRRITDGVDSNSLRRGPEGTGLTNRLYRKTARSLQEKPTALICAYANDEIGDACEHTLLRALAIRGAIVHWMPLPDWNGNLASLVFRLYCLKHGLPALAYLPFSRANLEWERGRIRSPLVLASELPQPYVDERGYEDFTPTVTLAVDLVDYVLGDLMEYMKSTKEKGDAALAYLQHNTQLNHRQLLILSRALRDPEAEFTVRHHRTNHRVAYATARKDLLDLAEMGYLVSETRERTFFFRASPSLQERCERGG